MSFEWMNNCLKYQNKFGFIKLSYINLAKGKQWNLTSVSSRTL